MSCSLIRPEFPSFDDKVTTVSLSGTRFPHGSKS
jgi:hypothetical protein